MLPTCPHCGSSDQVEKVSQLFVHLSEAGGRPTPDAPSSELLVAEMPATARKVLREKLAPPRPERPDPMRPVHPDLIVLAFSLVIPAFISGIASSQRPFLVPAVVLLVVVYAAYVWQRRGIIRRYEDSLEQRKKKERTSQRALQRWMQTYYCAEDGGLFEPTRQNWQPADASLPLWQVPE